MKSIKELDEWCRTRNRSIIVHRGQLRGISNDNYAFSDSYLFLSDHYLGVV